MRLLPVRFSKAWRSRVSVGIGPVMRRRKSPEGENPVGNAAIVNPPPGNAYAMVDAMVVLAALDVGESRAIESESQPVPTHTSELTTASIAVACRTTHA